MHAMTKPTLSAAQAERLWQLVQALRVASSEDDSRHGCATPEWDRRERAFEQSKSHLWRFCAHVESRRASRGR